MKFFLEMGETCFKTEPLIVGSTVETSNSVIVFNLMKRVVEEDVTHRLVYTINNSFASVVDTSSQPLGHYDEGSKINHRAAARITTSNQP